MRIYGWQIDAYIMSGVDESCPWLEYDDEDYDEDCEELEEDECF